MTGFARRERQYPFGLIAWELKTVNHRFLEISCRLPEDFRAAESEFRQTIAGAVRRGKVDGSLHFRPATAATTLEVDADLLASLTQTGAAGGAAGRSRRAHRRDRSAPLAGRRARASEGLRTAGRGRPCPARRGARRAYAVPGQRRRAPPGGPRAAVRGSRRFRLPGHRTIAGSARAHARPNCWSASHNCPATSTTSASNRSLRCWPSAWTWTRSSIACAAT